jgi:Lipocalin-like domain
MCRRKFIIVYSMALLGLMSMAIGTVAQQSTLKEQLVGTWSLVSAANEIDGKRIENFGSNPLGYMIFTSDGHFSVNFVRADRPNFASNNREKGTPEEYKAAVQGKISAFGRYTVDSDGSLTFQIAGSSFPNWNGTLQKRIVEVTGDQLKYITPATSIGGSAVSILTWAK